MSANDPLVSVVTPVYNGEPYIAECIASVLGQTYTNWEYIIVNNCSTDKTLEIAESFATRDPRVRIHNNAMFVGLIENHNIAFSLISPDSQYVKVVSADDWLYPECVSRMVEFAEGHLTVGIVGSYALSNIGIDSLGMPYGKTTFSSREIIRAYLLGEIESFATPSATLYRANIVRARPQFFSTSDANADLATALECLQCCEFGFVHQILSFQRMHPDSISHGIKSLDAFLVDKLDFLADYGAKYLTEEEHRRRKAELLHEYYRLLAIGLVNFRRGEYWRLHKHRLNRLGYSLYSWRLILSLLNKLADLVLNPKMTTEKILNRLRFPDRSASR